VKAGLEVVGPAAGPGLSCMTTAEGDRDAYSIPSRFFILKIAGDESKIFQFVEMCSSRITGRHETVHLQTEKEHAGTVGKVLKIRVSPRKFLACHMISLSSAFA